MLSMITQWSKNVDIGALDFLELVFLFDKMRF